MKSQNISKTNRKDGKANDPNEQKCVMKRAVHRHWSTCDDTGIENDIVLDGEDVWRKCVPVTTTSSCNTHTTGIIHHLFLLIHSRSQHTYDENFINLLSKSKPAYHHAEPGYLRESMATSGPHHVFHR